MTTRLCHVRGKPLVVQPSGRVYHMSAEVDGFVFSVRRRTSLRLPPFLPRTHPAPH